MGTTEPLTEVLVEGEDEHVDTALAVNDETAAGSPQQTDEAEANEKEQLVASEAETTGEVQEQKVDNLENAEPEKDQAEEEMQHVETTELIQVLVFTGPFSACL